MPDPKTPDDEDIDTFSRGDGEGKPGPDETADPADLDEGEEGDGWVLSVIYRGGTDRSDLAIYDAQNLGAGPIALARLPRRVPFGFHGNWRAA
jgi:hypothetical protein